MCGFARQMLQWCEKRTIGRGRGRPPSYQHGTITAWIIHYPCFTASLQHRVRTGRRCPLAMSEPTKWPCCGQRESDPLYVLQFNKVTVVFSEGLQEVTQSPAGTAVKFDTALDLNLLTGKAFTWPCAFFLSQMRLQGSWDKPRRIMRAPVISRWGGTVVLRLLMFLTVWGKYQWTDPLFSCSQSGTKDAKS